MQAFLKNNRQAPRKVRLLARAVIGKTVPVALSELTFMPHKGAKTLSKLIVSAVANAKQANTNLSENNLMVKNITVDKGVTLMRFMPRAFGRASPIHKESSHIRVLLAEVGGSKKVATVTEKVEGKKEKEIKKSDKVTPKVKAKKETKVEEATLEAVMDEEVEVTTK